MTEREMLELAAKACGYEHFRYCEVHMALVPEAEGEDALPFSVWNPLTDDGDALRLAVKLNLTVRITDSAAIVFELCGKHDAVELLSRHGDLCSAARRAIVRAAAEIGRAMP